MSDSAQGPGWWQASDGKWYAPDQQLAAPQPTLPPPAAPQPTIPVPVPPPGTPPAPPDPESGKKPWWQRWWAIALGVLVVLIVLAVVFAPSGDDDPDATTDLEQADSTSITASSAPAASAASTTPATSAPSPSSAPSTTPPTTAPAISSTVPPTAPPTTPVAPTAPPLPGFGPGVVLIGTDAQPGIYRATVPSDAFGCYWERLSDLSGEFEAILANDNVTPGDVATVELAPTDAAFNSDGCGNWTVFVPPAQPASTFGGGTWLVNNEILPGRYQSTGPEPDDFGCYWERRSSVRGDLDSIIANDNVEGPTVVDISASDFAFKSSGCGTWTLVP